MKKLSKTLLSLFFLPIIGLSQPYPGGISTNIELWLKADLDAMNEAVAATDGQSVNTWKDQTSARTNDATDTNFSTPPTYRVNASDNINYNPVVDFDGVNDNLDFRDDYIFSSGTDGHNGMNWFAVVEPDNAASTKSSQFIIDFGLNATEGYGFSYGYNNFNLHTPTGFSGKTNSATHAYNSQPTIARFTINFGSTQTFTLNGAASPSITDNIPSLASLTASNTYEGVTHNIYGGPFTIGRQCKNDNLTNNGGRLLDGSIAEIVGYSQQLSAVQIQKIESYLAVKYGITLDNTGGGTAGDYIDSDGTLLWDASTGSSYHHDVIGIGRDDSSVLLQKQSHSKDDQHRLFSSTLQVTNSSNSASFTDKEFVMIGHNNDLVYATTSSKLERPSGIYSKLEREWKITNTGFTPSWNIAIALATDAITPGVDPADLRILIDDDGDFSSGASVYLSGESGFVINYDEPYVTVTFAANNTVVPANSTKYFTIGSVRMETPLPVLFYNFQPTILDNNQVAVSWSTSWEQKNKFFTVERSHDSKHWQVLYQLDTHLDCSDIPNLEIPSDTVIRKYEFLQDQANGLRFEFYLFQIQKYIY